MIRNLLTAGAAAAALFASAHASADVLYRWEQVSTFAPEPSSLGPITSSFGSIVLTDQAADGRVTNYSFNSFDPEPDRSAPVSFFSFGINGNDPRSGGIQISPATAGRNLGLQVTNLRDEGGVLFGRIFAFDANRDALLSLNPIAAGLQSVQADFLATCPNAEGDPIQGCGGAAGRFVRVAGTVPEPGVLSLMALASAGIGATLRRRRSR